MINAGIIGGTGYTGVELLRLLIQHPGAEVTTISSRSEKGKNVADVFPSLCGYTDLQFCDPRGKFWAHNDMLEGWERETVRFGVRNFNFEACCKTGMTFANILDYSAIIPAKFPYIKIVFSMELARKRGKSINIDILI